MIIFHHMTNCYYLKNCHDQCLTFGDIKSTLCYSQNDLEAININRDTKSLMFVHGLN